eukprot:TRINITY_DN54183_c0_g1_i1.p1 TRINITY_DN54183_c0_g1~~TRINITY_DN54183_c0_g1_i1.p1  ORF type:complete len:264 (+),score=34.51 TRINITY_DN54183_c0_g1_i1:129-920(+)
MATSSVNYYPVEKIYTSTPSPMMFGNGPNKDPNVNWLRSRMHFSFAEYHDPNRNSFGRIRVLNDDLVQPERGFGTHPHREMEIVTYIVEGELTHQDSSGNAETLGRGAVQYMSAGTGISHSEFNHHKTKPLRFLQMWYPPSERGLKPNYGSYSGSADARKNQWHHLVSNAKTPQQQCTAPVRIYTDINLFSTEIDSGKSLNFDLQDGRQAYFVLTEGALEVTHSKGVQQMKAGDAAEFIGKHTLTFNSKGDVPAHCVLVEMSP